MPSYYHYVSDVDVDKNGGFRAEKFRRVYDNQDKPDGVERVSKTLFEGRLGNQHPAGVFAFTIDGEYDYDKVPNYKATMEAYVLGCNVMQMIVGSKIVDIIDIPSCCRVRSAEMSRGRPSLHLPGGMVIHGADAFALEAFHSNLKPGQRCSIHFLLSTSFTRRDNAVEVEEVP